MNAITALAESRLADAIVLQTEEVAWEPKDSAARLFLFELLLLSGDLTGASNHLDRIQSNQPTWSDTRRRFQLLMRAEQRRSPQIYRPRFLEDPPIQIKRRWNATRAHRLASSERTIYWLDRADASSPEVQGFVDGREFTGLRDTDDRFADLFELFLNGRYIWVPYDTVRSIRIRPAVGVSDVAFREAELILKDGRTFTTILPTRYPGSGTAGDHYALAEAADWTDESGLVCGIGAKILTFGDEDSPLTECRMIEFR
jgi:type VI secretion system protein ImpE